jgi:hypothetical protein
MFRKIEDMAIRKIAPKLNLKDGTPVDGLCRRTTAQQSAFQLNRTELAC